MTYLGHVFSEDGIKTDPAKVTSVRNFPAPRNLKELRSFLGFCGYYRRFVEGYASIVRSLNDLLVGHGASRTKTKSKSVKFVWGVAQQEAFDKVISKITAAPVLAYADYSKPFILHTDASSTGLGAVLYQVQDGVERVIAYASRSLKPSEKNYSAYKLEFLALKWAITDKFHDFLYGTKFTARTDNNLLTYIMTTARLDATGQRWVAALSTYDFDLKYRSGKKNVNADTLSRLPGTEGGTDGLKIVNSASVKAVTDACMNPQPLVYCLQQYVHSEQSASESIGFAQTWSSQDWVSGQSADPVVAEVVRVVRDEVSGSSSLSSRARFYAKFLGQLCLKDDVLCRKTTINGDPICQVVLPENVRLEVFRALHDPVSL